MTDLALPGRLMSLLHPVSFAFVRKLKYLGEKKMECRGMNKRNSGSHGFEPLPTCCAMKGKMANSYNLLVCSIPESGV